MNRNIFSGRVIQAVYTPAHDQKKSRAVVKVALMRKGKETEIEYTAFSSVADFIAKGQGLMPIENGNYIQENRKCFLPGCRIEGIGYVQNTPYLDRNGISRPGYQFLLEEVSSEPIDQEGALWINQYGRKAPTPSGRPQGMVQNIPMPHTRTNGQQAYVNQMQRPYQPSPGMQTRSVYQAKPMAQTTQISGQHQSSMESKTQVSYNGASVSSVPQMMPGVPQGGFRPGFVSQRAGGNGQ